MKNRIEVFDIISRVYYDDIQIGALVVLRFDWDHGNINKNWVKHRVSKKEIEEVFKNKPHFLGKDDKHSKTEKRFEVRGKTEKGRLITVIFAIRESKIRPISARDLNRKERKQHAKEEIKKYSKI